MLEKQIQLLNELLSRLDKKPFDLQSWKTNAIMILGRIFGENSRKTEMVKAIQPDFSSWSLRDTTGKISQMDECRKMGREIIEAAISELESFGVPGTAAPSGNQVMTALEEYVTVKQSKEIAEILKSDQSAPDKVIKIKELLNGLDQVDLLDIVAKALAG